MSEESDVSINLLDVLDDRSIDLNFEAADKSAAIAKLTDLLDAAGAVVDKAEYIAKVQAREQEYSTGLGMGIAIPHGKTDAISRPAVAFGRSATGIDWGADDGSLAHLIFIIGVPEAQAGQAHLRILAALSRRLVHADFRNALMEAVDIDAVKAVLKDVTA